MNRFDRAACAAALTLALTPLTATAEAERIPVAVYVAVRDLDLTTPRGQNAFNARVRRAAIANCGTAHDLRTRFDVLRCRSEMQKDAQVRLAALTGKRAIELAAVNLR